MHEVIYINGKQTKISDSQAFKIELLKKQGMLNTRQQVWMKQVKEISPLRHINQHTLAKTKDMTCECSKCR